MCRKTENQIFLAAPVRFHDPGSVHILKEQRDEGGEIETTI
jgi:hypothetical protein